MVPLSLMRTVSHKWMLLFQSAALCQGAYIRCFMPEWGCLKSHHRVESTWVNQIAQWTSVYVWTEKINVLRSFFSITILKHIGFATFNYSIIHRMKKQTKETWSIFITSGRLFLKLPQLCFAKPSSINSKVHQNSISANPILHLTTFT